LDRESLRLSLASKGISRDLREVASDIRKLSRSQILAEYLSEEGPVTRARLEQELVDVGASARIYDQVRYIDRSGQEQIRIDFHAGVASPVPAERLQDKSGRYYVREALKLRAGEIYISRLDLNVEEGKIERPLKPTIRVAAPAFDAAGQLKGIIVLNYLAGQLLNSFRDVMAGSWGKAAIVNPGGYWLYAPDKKDEWGFMFGTENSFATRYPVAWRHILRNESGEVTTPSGLFLFQTVHPYASATLRHFNTAGGGVSEHFWKLIERVPNSMLGYSPIRAMRTQSGEMLALWALVGILSLLLAALRTSYAAGTRALRKSRSNLALAQQLSHIGNWEWDIPSSRFNWSTEACNIFGLPMQHSIDFQTFIARVHPNDRGAVNEAIAAALQSGNLPDTQHRIVCPDGTVRTVHERGTVTFDKNGAPVRMFGTIQDITDRTTTEARLRDSEQRFRQLAEHIDAVFWLTAWPQNVVMYVSPAFEGIWGFPAQQLYDDPMAWTQAIAPEDRARVEQTFMNTVGSGGYDVTYRIVRPDGEARRIHDRAFLIRNEQGEVYRIAGVASDISARYQAEQELQKHKAHLEELVAERTAELQASNRELESMNYSLAHDLRTPLRAVTSFSQILAEEAGPKLTPAERDHLYRITRAGKHMALLLDAMAELGRIGRTEMTTRIVDLSAIAKGVMDRLQRSRQPRPVAVHIMPGLQDTGDVQLLTIAITNLLEHAWKNAGECSDPRIEFGAMDDSEKGCTVYYVCHNGVGFDMKYVDVLFEPFQYLYKSDEPRDTGIVLASVYRIIRRHKGRIWAEAHGDGGETFYFTLGRSREEPDESVRARQSAGPGI